MKITQRLLKQLIAEEVSRDQAEQALEYLETAENSVDAAIRSMVGMDDEQRAELTSVLRSIRSVRKIVFRR